MPPFKALVLAVPLLLLGTSVPVVKDATLAPVPDPASVPLAKVAKPVGDRQEITVTGETKVAVGDMAVIRVSAPGAKAFDWTPANHERQVFDPLETGSYISFSCGTQGEYVWVVSVADGATARPTKVRITVGHGPQPPPPGPQPPGPQPPGPQPPGPTPDDAAPFAAKGLTVLFVVDESKRNELTAGQRQVLFGPETKALLNERTIKGPDGKTNEWRVWHDTQDVTAAGEPWVAAMKAAKEQPIGIAKVVISNGKTGFNGPLNPEVTPASFRELLSKY